MPAAYMQRPIPRVAADMSFMVVPTATPTIAHDLVFSDGDLQRWGRRCRANSPEAPDSDDDHGSEAGVGNSVKIPKPVGEPGRRPERGGFPLKQQLVSVERWEEKTYEEIQVRQLLSHNTTPLTDCVQAAVRKAALATLNPSLSFKFQDKHRIDLICAKVCLIMSLDRVFRSHEFRW